MRGSTGTGQAWRVTAVGLAALAAGGASCPALFLGQQQTMQCDGTRVEADARTGMAECTDLPEFGVSCTETFTIPEAAVDLVFVIDNSGSMGEELADVREHINAFSRSITDSGLDHRVVMVSEKGNGSNSICVPEPLAGPGCGDSARFRHVDAFVNSSDPPEVLLASWQAMQDFLRDDARHAVIFITDDNATMSATTYLDSVRGLRGLDGATVHAVVGTNTTDCPDADGRGTTYMQLAARTGGLSFPICCADYGRLFSALAVDVALSVRTFRLARDISSVSTVGVYTQDGTGVRTPLATGWTVDSAANAVVFEEGAVPAPGTTVVITYGST